MSLQIIGAGRRILLGVGRLNELLGRTLVIVPHPDDECLAYGMALQRMREAHVLYVTDGAPQDPYFWKRFGSREAYAKLRQEEARSALSKVNIRNVTFLNGFQDQCLFLRLDDAYKVLEQAVERLRPEALASLAYEGGHPDHDSCSLLTSELSRAFGVPAWEAPLYHREPNNPDGHVVQDFVSHDGLEEFLHGDAGELERKRAMCESYPSQGDFLKTFSLEREMVRPMHAYDYRRPPHPGRLNYEAWEWSMTGDQVCREFEAFLARRGSNR